jgi:hypothetical protein
LLSRCGLPAVDAQTGKVLLALSKAGVFRLRGVVVGTHAFRCYPGLLGVEIQEARAVTEDIDLAARHSISVALDDRLDPSLAQVLRRIGPFIARPNLHKKPPAWRDPDSGTVVELPTPNEGPDREEPMELPAPGAYAQPLRFLDYLIHQPVQAAALYRSGVFLNIPQPARYAIHKLIVATRRADTQKAGKDIQQSAALIRVLAEDRPDELEEAFLEASARGPSWRDHLDKGVRRLPEDAREALMNAIEQGAARELASELPNTIEELVAELESSSSEQDVEIWTKGLGATSDCGICSTTIIRPDTFAEAAVQHYEIPHEDADAVHERIENALRTSAVETGGWGDGSLCAYHNEMMAKDD